MTDPSAVTLREAYDAWVTARAPRKESPHTTAAYERDVRMVAGSLGVSGGGDPLAMLAVPELTTARMRSAFAAFAEGHERSSIARAHSTWSGFTAFCVAEGWLLTDPMVGVARPTIPRRAPKPLTPVRAGTGTEDTARALMTWLIAHQRGGIDKWPERDRAVMITLLLTGMRSAELRGLDVRDLAGAAGDRRFAVVGKGSKPRSLPIRDELDSLLAAYQATRTARHGAPASGDPFFVDRRGQRLTASQLRYLVRSCCQAAGLGDALPQGAAAHSLRHTFATLLAAQGATAVELMELLGHASLATSQNYVLASAREVRAAASSNPLYAQLNAQPTGRAGEAAT